MGKIVGKLNVGSVLSFQRSVSMSDSQTLDIEIIGDYKVLENLVINSEPGDSAAPFVSIAGGDNLLNYKIKTCTCQRDSGGTGVLRASLVYAESKDNPYHYTYTIDMVEDSRPLIAHPKIANDYEAIDQIRKWEQTPVAKQYQDGKFMYYDESNAGSESGIESAYVEVDNENALNYCNASWRGIDHYNVYLPVVSKTSMYLGKPPGASQNKITKKLSGNISFSGTIGKWDSGFGFTIAGFKDDANGGWFKTKDSYSQNADGTWQRQEEWVYSDSKATKWIYE